MVFYIRTTETTDLHVFNNFSIKNLESYNHCGRGILVRQDHTSNTNYTLSYVNKEKKVCLSYLNSFEMYTLSAISTQHPRLLSRKLQFLESQDSHRAFKFFFIDIVYLRIDDVSRSCQIFHHSLDGHVNLYSLKALCLLMAKLLTSP